MRRELCESAKQGRLCIDDLCHTGGETLCGFCQYDYDDMTSDSEEPFDGEEPCMHTPNEPREGLRERVAMFLVDGESNEINTMVAFIENELAAARTASQVETPTDEELSKGTFSCPICGLGTPHSGDAHGATVLPEVIYGVPSYDKTFLVWVGSDKQKAMWMADFSRNVIEYRRANAQRLECMTQTLAELRAELASARADELRTIIGRIKCFAEGTGATIEMVLANPGIGEDAKQLATAVRAAQSAAVAAALEAERTKAALDELNRRGHDSDCRDGQWLSGLNVTSGCTCGLEARLTELRARAEGQTGGGK
jgi:hypothetical protein